jgi:hypothetical protein
MIAFRELVMPSAVSAVRGSLLAAFKNRVDREHWQSRHFRKTLLRVFPV